MMPPASLRDILRADVPLSELTTWQIGGPARWVAEPRREQLVELFHWIRDEKLPYVFLGRGSNVLAPDEGFSGVVILTRNSLRDIRRDGDHLFAEAGCSLPALSKAAAREGSRGFEFLIGIPGTVGGALTMNAGLTVFRPREIREVTHEIEFLDENLEFHRCPYAECHPTYRTSDFVGGRRMITAGWFTLGDFGDPQQIHHDTLEHLRDRKSKQPLDKPTAGSTFKQPAGGHSAGWYIEHAELKGTQIGNARISPKHANWIENLGNATAADVVSLLELVSKTVQERFGVELQPEVRLLQEGVHA